MSLNWLKRNNQSSFHEDFSREEKFERSSDRSFGLVFAGFFALASGLSYWRGNPRWYIWACLAILCLVLAIGAPKLLSPFNWVWTQLGLVLFRVISPIALAVVYYVVMTPMGFLLRLSKKDVLGRKFDPYSSSYWIARNPPGPEPKSMINQF